MPRRSSALRPVRLHAPGMTLDKVADRLGVTGAAACSRRASPADSRRTTCRASAAAGASRGHCSTPTNRSTHPRTGSPPPTPSGVAATAAALPGRLSPDLPPETLRRVPRPVRRHRPDVNRDTTGLHPEHPELDPPVPSKPLAEAPPPPPDYVAYKWKDGEYVGHDWRNPAARGTRPCHSASHCPAPRQEASRRAARPEPAEGLVGIPWLVLEMPALWQGGERAVHARAEAELLREELLVASCELLAKDKTRAPAPASN